MRRLARKATLVFMPLITACVSGGEPIERFSEVEEEALPAYTAQEPPRFVAVVKDTTPTDPAELYRLANTIFKSARETGAEDRVRKLQDVIRLFLLAADSLPQEVKPDIEEAFDVVLTLPEDIYSKDIAVVYLLEAWDRNVDVSITRAPLLAYKKKYTEEAHKEGFNKNLRYRYEDERDRNSPLNTCSYVVNYVYMTYEIARRLKTADAWFWRQHRTDLLTRNVECEGMSSTVGEPERVEGYAEYMAMGLPQDAKRVSREAADENLSLFAMGDFSNVSGKLIVPPGDTAYLNLATMWSERVSLAFKRTLWKKYAKQAEKLENFSTAEVLYRSLGDSVNARRMKMRKSQPKSEA